jgi:hypothetical protein
MRLGKALLLPLINQIAMARIGTIVLLMTVACSGCGGTVDKSAIVGQVTFKNGEIIKRGLIEFTPIDSEPGGSGGSTSSGARIFEGSYDVPQEKGLHPGRYLVRISAPSATLGGEGPPGSSAMTLPTELVSAKYNSESTLEIEVMPGEAEQRFDFEVE